LVRRQNDTSVTRAAITAEAARLVDKGGVSALSVSQIARTLTMSHGNIYRHFPSKDAIAAEIASQWMAAMREACEQAIQTPLTVRSKLLALVMAIRKELFKRADVPDALSIFNFVLEHKPEAAVAHHLHRRDLVVGIMTGAGWPSGPATEREAQTILDALRFYTDPHAVSAYWQADVSDQIERVVGLLTENIERHASGR